MKQKIQHKRREFETERNRRVLGYGWAGSVRNHACTQRGRVSTRNLNAGYMWTSDPGAAKQTRSYHLPKTEFLARRLYLCEYMHIVHEHRNGNVVLQKEGGSPQCTSKSDGKPLEITAALIRKRPRADEGKRAIAIAETKLRARVSEPGRIHWWGP
jgi:hypothetical protein